MGTRCAALGVLDSLTELRSAIADWKPDVVFNLLEEFDGIVTYDQHVVAFLELMRQPYTGCNPRGLLLSRDKSLCKQLLAFIAFRRRSSRCSAAAANPRARRSCAFRCSSSPSTEDASLGIAQASVVEDAAQLKERIEFVHEQMKSDALVEEYIEGRELYVGMMGNERLTRLPVWEMVFGSHAGVPRRDRHAQGEMGQALPGRSTASRPTPPSDLPPAVDRAARQAVAAHLSGARPVGLCAHGFPRDRADGQVYVLEANANPNLEAPRISRESARAAGYRYDELLERLMT